MVARCRIVPAIDLIDGRAVRLAQGSFDKRVVVAEDPVETAQRFEQQGYSRLHLVDLSGAQQGKPCHLGVLERIARTTSLSIDFSGGLRRQEEVTAALASGAHAVVIGSAAVLMPELVEELLRTLTPARVIVALDLLDGEVRIKGWGEGGGVSPYTVVEGFLPYGLSHILSTSIRCDGMLAGPDLGLYETLTTRYPELQVIASGGVSRASDVVQLAACGVAEVIVGKALYEGRIDAREAAGFIW